MLQFDPEGRATSSVLGPRQSSQAGGIFYCLGEGQDSCSICHPQRDCSLICFIWWFKHWSYPETPSQVQAMVLFRTAMSPKDSCRKVWCHWTVVAICERWEVLAPRVCPERPLITCCFFFLLLSHLEVRCFALPTLPAKTCLPRPQSKQRIKSLKPWTTSHLSFPPYTWNLRYFVVVMERWLIHLE